MSKQSDGLTAEYYMLPKGATELQHLISAKNMNAQLGEIFRACYRYGEVEHSPKERDIRKIIFYAQAEMERLEMLKAPQHGVGDCDLCGRVSSGLVEGACPACVHQMTMRGVGICTAT